MQAFKFTEKVLVWNESQEKRLAIYIAYNPDNNKPHYVMTSNNEFDSYQYCERSNWEVSHE